MTSWSESNNPAHDSKPVQALKNNLNHSFTWFSFVDGLGDNLPHKRLGSNFYCLKGCAQYIFASIFCKSTRKHL